MDRVTYASNVEKKLAEYDEKLGSQDNELSELKIAYKEKLRKCQAWEKAYHNLKSQLGESQPSTHESKPSV